VGAIYVDKFNTIAEIDQDTCVECNNCYRNLRSEGYPSMFVRLIRRVTWANGLVYDHRKKLDVCPTGALLKPELQWPRSVREAFSDLTIVKPTGMQGRGTEEVKTNEVTGRMKEDEVGFTFDMGRPGLGVRFTEVEKMTTALVEVGVKFEENNPVTQLMVDDRTGKFRDDVLKERVLSCIIEIKVKAQQVPRVLDVIKELSQTIDTVFSVGIMAPYTKGGALTYPSMIRERGLMLSPNGKVNLGFGRPNLPVSNEGNFN
jgi:hypothetical protein